MSRFISVTGSPHSGKTVLALKLAQALYVQSTGPVIYLSPDMATPALSVIFPGRASTELYSLGALFDRTEIREEDVLRSMVTTKAMSDLGYLGYVGADNRYTYPMPTGDKLLALYAALRNIAEYIVVDACDPLGSAVTRLALKQSEVQLCLATPDFSSLAYYNSQATIQPAFEGVQLFALNHTDGVGFAPEGEMKKYLNDTFGSLDFSVPHSKALQKQYVSGTLGEELSDKRFKKVMNAICERVMQA